MAVPLIPVVAAAAANLPRVASLVGTFATAVGVKSLKSAQEVLNYVKANPGTAATLAVVLADAGIDVYNYFTADDKKAAESTPDGKAILERLKSGVAAQLDKDSKLVFKDTEEEYDLLQELVPALERFFQVRGDQLLAIHGMMRTFVNLPSSTVARGVRRFGGR